MPVSHTAHPSIVDIRSRRSCWYAALAALVGLALLSGWLAARGPVVAVYATTDFTHLPGAAGPSTSPAASDGCASIRKVGDSKELVEEECGSQASTFRVIGRVSDTSQCVGDADLIYTWSTQMLSGAVCLDYDWTHGQCLLITADTASKADCLIPGAVQPDQAIIGAVDVSYCCSGGIPHPVRHFAVCTTPGNESGERSMR